MIFVVILLSIFSFSYLWVKKRFSFWRDYGFEQVETSFPFGSVSGMGSDITFAEGFDKFYKNFKGKVPAVGFYSFFSPQILIIEPDLVKETFVREFQNFQDRGMYHNPKDDPMGTK
jgi:cytochrome P450 family 6